MSDSRPVIHPKSVMRTSAHPMIGNYVSGGALEQAEANAARWAAEGFSVESVPADGREHPRGRRCPICSDGGRDDLAKRAAWFHAPHGKAALAERANADREAWQVYAAWHDATPGPASFTPGACRRAIAARLAEGADQS